MNQNDDIERLETKLAFQEDNIETLNTELFDMQRKMQILTEQVSFLVTKLKESDSNQVEVEEEDMRPPHY